MLTRIPPRRAPHLYITEHREAQGLSVERVAGRIKLGDKEGVSRETVWRWENEQNRLRPEKVAAIADALGLKTEDLYRPPGRPSLDALVRDAPDDLVQDAADIIRRLVKRA